MFQTIGFLSTAAYWPAITGAAINTVWVALSFALPFALWRGTAHPVPTNFCALAFIGIAFAGVAAPTLAAVEAAWHYGCIILTCALGLSGRGDFFANIVRGAIAGLSVSLIVALFHLHGTPIVPQQNGYLPAGLFVNPNFFGVVAALLAVASFAVLDWRWAVVPFICVVLSGSRTAVLLLAVAGLHWLWQNHWRLFMWAMVAAMVIVPIAIAANPGTVAERLDLWHATVLQLTWLGHGLGAAPDFVEGIRIAQHAHNAALQLVFEVGIFAVPLLFACVRIGLRTPIALCALFCIVTMEALQQPSVAFLCALFVGHALSGKDGLRPFVRVRDRNGVAGAECRRYPINGVSPAQSQIDRACRNPFPF